MEADEGYLKFIFFDLISKKGSALFKNTVNKLEQSFNKLEIDEAIRLDVEKSKIRLRRELEQ